MRLNVLLDFCKSYQSMTQSYKVAEHSKISYQKLTESGRLTRYKAAILNELKVKPATRRTLAKKLKAVHPSNLCAPLKSLENEGIIKVLKSIQDKNTGREVNLYGLVDASNSLYINRNLSTCSLHSEGLDNAKKTSL